MADPFFQPLQQVRSRVFAMAQEDVDTDQILPARFMAIDRRVDLADALFRDWRSGPGGHASRLETMPRGAHQVLVAGRNFGAGSSREHAVWALVDFGFRVVVSSKVADIFAGNAVRNGLLTVEVPTYIGEKLLGADGLEVMVDLLDCTLAVPAIGLVHTFAIDPFARLCLLEGRDALGFLLDQQAAIAEYLALCSVPSPDLRAALARPA